MLKTFEAIKPFLHPTKVSIDNVIFKLHYRLTFLLLLVFTILVTSRQYIGEHIKCITNTIPEHVVNTFCFVTTTFTVVRHLNNSALDNGALFQPGIGPYHSDDEPIKRHAYYQWVPFVLFGQALCFLVPHFVWKRWEGGRIKKLVVGFKMAGLSKYIHSKIKFGGVEIPSVEESDERVRDIRHEIKYRMRLNRQWGVHLMLAEWMNLVNIVFQIWWTNIFLGGQFYSLGPKVLRENWQNKMDILDVVFPKVTKCHFHKYGPSGSLQIHDTLCVMALNIINEKIYTILWFWFAFVLIASILAVIWRAFTLLMYKNKSFSEFAFRYAKSGRRVNKRNLYTVVQECNFSNWMFLYFLASHLSDFVFNKVIDNFAAEFTEFHPGQAKYIEPTLKRVTETPSGSSLDAVDSPLLSQEGSKSD